MHATSRVGERRRSRRVRTTDKLQAQLVPLELQVTVLDISQEGFALVSQIEFRRGQEYEFEFSSARTASVRLIGTNVHCLHVVSGGNPSYVAGFSFPPDAVASSSGALAALIDESRSRTTERASADFGSTPCISLRRGDLLITIGSEASDWSIHICYMT
jgi:hypothetical protein